MTNYTIYSASGTRQAVVETKVCSGSDKHVSYRMTVDGQTWGGGVVENSPKALDKVICKIAKSMLVGVESVFRSQDGV